MDLEGHKIRLAKRISQSINICLDDNKYDSYLIKPPFVLSKEEMQNKIEKFRTIKEYINWLLKDRHAVHLGTREKNNTNAIQPSKYNPECDVDIEKIKNAVENSIDNLIKQFIKFPYRHRVESSIHTELFHIMKDETDLSNDITLADNTKTQLVHNEWPSIGIVKGNYDFAVLTPEILLKDCPNNDIFSRGKINVPIVIELGLNPPDSYHLTNDKKKIIDNKIHAGYLIHLLRDKSENTADESIIIDTSNLSIKTAYALVNNKKIRYKYVNDTRIIETTTAAWMPPSP
jgi:hypothetical protein